MGIRLSGPRLTDGVGKERLSSAVVPGTIQVPPDGQPIILMVDAQTIGGYPRLGQVIAADLPKLAQLRPGQSVQFQRVDRDEATRALTARERKVIVPVLGFAVLLFMAGVALALFVFVPVTVQLLVGVQSDVIAPLITAEDYFGFIFFISLAFGAVFELPILILILTALGLVTPKTLIGIRRWAIVVSLIVCEIITPGDAVISTLILWVPVYGLYELSIVISWFVQRAKQKRAAASEQIGAGVTE